MKFRKSALMFLLAPCFMLACNAADSSYNGGGNNDNNGKIDKIDFNTAKPAALSLAENCGDLKKEFLDALAVSVAEQMYTPYYFIPMNGGIGALPPTADGAPKNDGPSDYTDTNVQEKGVDEADLSETDGNHIYVIREDNADLKPSWENGRSSKVVVLKSWAPEETAIVAEIESPLKTTEDRRVFAQHKGMYLIKGTDGKGKKLVVLSSVTTEKLLADFHKMPKEIFAIDAPEDVYENWTTVEVYNVENPASPVLLSAKAFSGDYGNSRLIGNKLILSSQYNSFYKHFEKAFKHKYEGVDKVKNEGDLSYEDARALIVKNAPIIRRQLDELMKDFDSSELLPSAAKYDKDGTLSASEGYLSCNDVYLAEALTAFNGFLTVASVDIDNVDTVKANAVTGYGWDMYASTKNVYITRSTDGWFWRCPEDNCSQGKSKIYKFKLNDNGVQYTAAGEIPGYIKDQFSFGETIDGQSEYLKVATTEAEFKVDGTDKELIESWTAPRRSGTVSVLEENAGRLEVVGKVEGLGKDEGENGEEIKSVRYIGDKGYVVTFERTDPLFVIDFSTIRTPKKVGELKVPGFSSYIHPMADNRLLTIGKDGTKEGLNDKMKLEIFDVSDPANPKSESQLSFGEEWGHSAAEYDHHAFTYHSKSGFLAIPYASYNFDFDAKFGGRSISGTLIFKVTGNANEGYKLTEHGEVDHSDFYSEGSHYWYAGVLRNTMMFGNPDGNENGYLYSLGTHGVKVNALDDAMTPVATVPFSNSVAEK